MVVDKYIALKFPSGSVSALDYAQKLIIFINTIIAASVTSVAYPLMANMRSNEDIHGFLEILKKSILYLAILLIPITFGVIIFSEDIVKIVYARGAFDKNAVQITSFALLGYGFGIFFTGLRDILNSTLFSMGKTKVTTVNGVVGVIINITFCIILSRYFGIMGIALASVIAMAVTAILLFRSVIKLEKDFIINDIIKKIALITISSLIMGLVIIIVVINLRNTLGSIPLVLFGGIIGVVVYFTLCHIFKIEEIIEIKSLILKRIKR